MGSMISMVSMITVRMCVWLWSLSSVRVDVSSHENGLDDKTTFLLRLYEPVFRRALVIQSISDSKPWRVVFWAESSNHSVIVSI